MRHSISLLVASILSSTFALPIVFHIGSTASSTSQSVNCISLTGAYDFKSQTLSAILLDGGNATCAINNKFNIEAPDAPTAAFKFDCEEGYAASIPGDLREIRYQRPGSEAVVVMPQITVDHGGRREFVVSEVCKTELGRVEEGRVKSMKMEAGTVSSEEQDVKSMKMESGAEIEEQGVEIMKGEMTVSEEQGVGIVRS